LVRFHPFAKKPPPWTDMHQIWHNCRYTYKIFSGDQLRGVRPLSKWSKIALSHWQCQSPLTQGWDYGRSRDNIYAWFIPHQRWWEVMFSPASVCRCMYIPILGHREWGDYILEGQVSGEGCALLNALLVITTGIVCQSVCWLVNKQIQYVQKWQTRLMYCV